MNAPIDPDLHRAVALVVEGKPMMRNITANHLRAAGIEQVTSCGSLDEARLLLERNVYDIVVCSLEFEGSLLSGQDLLEELRREQLLPHRTVFIIVTDQATYARVTEAAEASLDGLIVQPFSGATLTDRLLEARSRKRLLSDVTMALEAGELEVALARAVKRFQERHRYWRYCARLSAELLLRLNRPDDAAKLFKRVLDIQPEGWARVGLVRADIAAGRTLQARKGLETLVKEDPQNADAQDLLGRLRVERAEFTEAMQSYRAAAELTPGCLLRAQHAGALAFHLGQHDEALKLLKRARALGGRSRLFDSLSLFLMALIQFDTGDRDGMDTSVSELRLYARRHNGSVRLARLSAAGETLLQIRRGESEAARDRLVTQGAARLDEGFDAEAAQLLLALWARLQPAMAECDERDRFIRDVALRFCTSRSASEVLIVAAGHDKKAARIIRQALAAVNTAAENALQQALEGGNDRDGENSAAMAAEQLLETARQTRNSRLIAMVPGLAEECKVAMGVDKAQAITEEARDLMSRYRSTSIHIAGILRSGRSPGGLVIRSGPDSLQSQAPS
jgi:DNA-binding response OmpR family regulator